MKEVIFYSYGDSNNASTWSNVPYLFTKELENCGIVVRRINIAPNRYVAKTFDLTISKLLHFCYPKLEYHWMRTPLFRKLTEYKIKQSVKTYPNADYCIFACFDFCNKYNGIPSMLFGDWTYSILIQDRQGRDLYSIEKEYIEQQNDAIRRAKVVVSLFPQCAENMKQVYPQVNIHYLGSNVINNLCIQPFNLDEIVKRKIKSKSVLFIGQKKYLTGANLLIQAMSKMHEDGLDYTLDIIGMKRFDFGVLPDFVKCHGYLRKDNKKENELYYRLMYNAKVFVNSTPVWAGFSSMIEAMYFATPIIVSPYEEFLATFGKDISFGYYNKDFTASSLLYCIKRVINGLDYESMCHNAHQVTKDYTWKAYIDKLMNIL